MNCQQKDENQRFKHSRKCRSYMKCYRNQAWLINCAETATGDWTFYNETLQRCLATEECFEFQQENVCYGARDGTSATFSVTQTGRIIKLRLIHVSGYLTNNSGYTSVSKWGYPDNKKIGTLITDGNNKVLFGSKSPYILPNYDGESSELVLDGTGTERVTKNEVLRVWYSEDIRNYTEGDNDGTHCITIYAVFRK